MDVNLTISLMRGQMGVVIEKAVNTAVETVLGEMIRVMSLKFEQLRKDMTAKEKENEDIRRMLESSRCQMKVLRQKYVNAMNAKDDRHAFGLHRHTPGHISAARHTAGQMNAAKSQQVEPDHGALHRRHVLNTGLPCAEAVKPRNTDPTPAANTPKDIHEAFPTESCQNPTLYNEEEPEIKAHLKGRNLEFATRQQLLSLVGDRDCSYCRISVTATIDHITKKHLKFAVYYSDGVMEKFSIPCHCPARGRGKRCHWHCAICDKIILRSIDFKHHLKNHVEKSNSIVPESTDPLWGQPSRTSPDTEHTEVAELNLQPTAHTSEVLHFAEAGCLEPVLRIKQEEDEVSIVEVKEEQPETSTSEFPRNELHQHLAGTGITVELPVTQQCIQLPSVTEPAFMGVDPSTYKQSKKARSRKYRDGINADPVKKQAKRETRQDGEDTESQLAVADTQRQLHPFCKDLMLYEDYKRKRIEVRKRSETRRRELERTLPQALLADLVKERREKTRLRVARWRAKRKLQACLMAQAAQFNSTQALYMQRNVRRRGGAAPQHVGIGLDRTQSETGVYTIPLQMATSPLLAAQRLSMAEGQMQPGASVFVQQRPSGAGPESYE